MTEHDNEDLAMENELSELRQQHDRLPKAEPTTSVDDVILRAARDRNRPRRHWPYLVAMAASVTAALVAFQVFLIQPPLDAVVSQAERQNTITVRRAETPESTAAELALPAAPESRARDTRPLPPGNLPAGANEEPTTKPEAMPSTEKMAEADEVQPHEEQLRMAVTMTAAAPDEMLDRQTEILADADAETWRKQILLLAANDQQALAEQLLAIYRERFPEEPGNSIAELRELAASAGK